MVKKTSIAIMLLACFVTTNSQAADKPADKPNVAINVGVVNVADILQALPEMKAASEKLRSQFEPRQQKIIAAQKKLNDDQAKLKRDATIMTVADREKLQSDIASLQRDLRRQQEDFMQDARAAEKKVMETMIERINNAVQEIAEAEHYDVILQRNVVAFASDRADLTKQVVSKLKKQKS